MEHIAEYIDPMLFPIALVLWVIGKGIKKSDAIQDERIPWILPVIGFALVALWLCSQHVPVGAEWLGLIYTAIIQGTLCAAAAVWGDQLIKQTQKANNRP